MSEIVYDHHARHERAILQGVWQSQGMSHFVLERTHLLGD
jgi:hypothetical protein